MGNLLSAEIESLDRCKGVISSGRVTQVIGLLIESSGPFSHLGELCYLYNGKSKPLPCEVVGFKKDKVLLMSLGEMGNIAPGDEIFPTGRHHLIPVTESMTGRVLDALGQPIDGKEAIVPEKFYPSTSLPPNALDRKLIKTPFATGVKAIDSLCTIGIGQRMGVFSGAGVGKSTLLGMIAKMSRADVCVIGLIGERGREVREFIERDLQTAGLARSVVVVATSDQPALLRVKGAHTATAIAEYYRDMGKNVLFIMDSITRFATALREIGLAIGEPPTTKGYTPSVFAELPKLLERTGNSDRSSITGIYSVLVEGDDLNDPIADHVRAILDGHIVLSRKLASSGHYPAIDILSSLSRAMIRISDEELYENATRLRALLQTYQESEDLIQIGAYTPGSNSELDCAINLMPKIKAFLTQDQYLPYSMDETLHLLKKVVR